MMTLVATLAACGGGGGGDDTPAPGPAPAPGTPIVVSGVATFESVPPASGSSGLNYAGAVDKPIRGATLQLLDATGNVLATTTTDATGAYSVNLATSQAVKVRVRAEIKRSGSANGDRDFSVLDNTSTGTPLYVLDSAAFTPTTNVTQNVRAASGWNGSSYAAARAAGPFSILDVAYQVQAKVATAAPTVNLPQLKIYWSVNNRPVSPFNASTGAIITSFFSATTAGALDRKLYILGAADTDTDEYDTHVIAHEMGHYLQSAISRDDSPGGSHGGGDKLDLRLAFSEGWGNGWSGIALADPRYVDSYNAGQHTSFSFDVSQPAAGADRGAYSETTGQYLVYTSSQSYGFPAVYGALGRFPASPAFSTLYNFADALKAVSPSNAGAINALFATQNIVTTDAFGTGETNDGGIASSLPVYKTYAAGQSLCVTNTADSRGDNDKLGEYLYIRFAATGSRTLTLTRTSASYSSPAVSDPDFTLLKADGSIVDASSSVDNVETLTGVSLPTGTHAIAFQDYNLPSTASGVQTSCFVFAVN